MRNHVAAPFPDTTSARTQVGGHMSRAPLDLDGVAGRRAGIVSGNCGYTRAGGSVLRHRHGVVRAVEAASAQAAGETRGRVPPRVVGPPGYLLAASDGDGGAVPLQLEACSREIKRVCMPLV